MLRPLLLALPAATVLSLPLVQQRLQPGDDHRQEGLGAQSSRLVLALPLPVLAGHRLGLLGNCLGLAEEHGGAAADGGLGERRRGHHAHVALQQGFLGVAIEKRRHRGQELRQFKVGGGALARHLVIAVGGGVDWLECGRLGVRL